jgi:5-methylthioadenosine/S-adenosylhomocysteine deaminase
MKARGDMLLTGARVYRHDGDTDLPPIQDVLISDGCIKAIGADTVHDATSERMDLSGHVLLPGFVNSHYHSHDVLAKGSFESLPLEQWGLIAGPIANNRSLEEVRIRTLVGAVEALRNGVTTVQDFSTFSPLSDEIVDTILGAYDEVGIRVAYSITVRDRSQLDTILDAREVVPKELWPLVGESAGDVQSQLAFVERQLDRVGDRGGRIIWCLSPSAPQRCSFSLLKGVADLAKRRDLPIFTHVYESRSQRIFGREQYAEFGGSIFKYMETCGLLGPHVSIAHGVWPDPEEINFLAGTGTGVVLNMLSNLKLRNGVAPISAYRRLGVPLALGSDNCSCSDIHSLFPVMKTYCLLGGIMEPESPPPTAVEAIRRATSGGAERAGASDKIGALEVGMRADIIALDLNDPAFRPLNSVARQVVHSETGRSVRHVWVDGRQVVANGAAITVDEQKLVSELVNLMPAVVSRLEELRDDASKLGKFFRELQTKAWSRPLTYNRYLQQS